MKRIEFEGKVHEFPDDFSDAEIASALGGTQSAGRTGGPRLTDLLRVTSGSPAMETGGRRGVSLLTTPESAEGERAASRGVSAATLRVAPSVGVAFPPAAAALSAGGETAAQLVESGEVTSPGMIGVAGVLPPAVATVARGVRAIGRTATRALPSLFVKAQEKAATGAQDVAERMAPTEAAGALFKAARGTGERVPAGRITGILDDLDTTIDPDPTNAGLQQVRAFVEKLRGKITGDEITLDDLMRQRLDLGREIARPGSAPELRAIYGHGGDGAKGIIGALEEASNAGGAGATAARQALTVFKRDLGVATWKDLVEQATKRVTVSGSDTPTLNMAKLGNLVAKNAEELERTVGPEGMALIRGFQEKFRALPPTQALTAANLLVSAGLGGVGAIAGGGVGMPVAGAAAGLAARELILNAWLVGKNPTAVNQVLTGLAQATRTGVTPMVQPFNGPRVRQGVPPRG